MKNNVLIRLTTQADALLLPAIEHSAGERFRDLPALAWIADGTNMSAQTHAQYIAQGTSWVAQVDGKLVGFLCAESVGSILHIWEFAVRLEWQGQGIGRKLIEAAIAYARNADFRAVTLTTFRDVSWNEPFYRAFGFETLSVETLEPRLLDILRFETQLGLPAALRCAMRLLLQHSA